MAAPGAVVARFAREAVEVETDGASVWDLGLAVCNVGGSGELQREGWGVCEEECECWVCLD